MFDFNIGRLVVGMSTLAICLPMAAFAADRAACEVTIQTPAPGATVGRAGIAEGTAVVPPGKFLWAYARIRGESDVWPQGGSARSLEEGGAWAVHVYWGERPDIGSEFELILQVVDANANTALAAWVQDTKGPNPPPPIKMPPSWEGCAIARVVVRKVSH